MTAFIAPPARAPFSLRIGIWISENIAGRTLLPARLLSWYPKAAFGSAILEGLAAHQDGKLNKRMLKLVRLAASFTVACPFCIEMNSESYREVQISDAELLALQQQVDPASVSSFSKRESLAVRYAQLVSSTPLRFPSEFIADLKGHFGEREMVVLATTTAQVNYWARLIQALGIPPAGMSDRCAIKTVSDHR